MDVRCLGGGIFSTAGGTLIDIEDKSFANLSTRSTSLL